MGESYWMDTDPVMSVPNPAAVFIFQYRSTGKSYHSSSKSRILSNYSTEALKSMHILPRTRSPTPIEERDPTNLDQEQMLANYLELQKQLKDSKVR